MGTVQKNLDELKLEGGHAALDFANSVDHRFKDAPRDALQSFADLVNWQVKAGLMPRGRAEAFVNGAAAHPRLSNTALETGLALREAIYRIFRNVAHRKSPDPIDLSVLNEVLAALRGNQRLHIARGAVGWDWEFDPARPVTVLGPVADAAAQLLTSDRLDRVKECPAPDGCGWLFLDTSRNRSRHWCSMRDCGNVAKVRRHRKRKESQA